MGGEDLMRGLRPRLKKPLTLTAEASVSEGGKRTGEKCPVCESSARFKSAPRTRTQSF